MAGIIKDLYGNSGNRFTKILAGIFNEKCFFNYLINLYLVSSLILSVGDFEKANTAPNP